MKEQFDVELIYVEDLIPDAFLDDERKQLDHITNQGFRTTVHKRPNELWMAADWMIPGLIILYFAQPYLRSVLSEAGKDHYHYFKSLIQSILKKSKWASTRIITSTKSPNKLSPVSNEVNQSLSIYIELRPSLRLKVLLFTHYQLDEYEQQMDTLFSQLKEYMEDPETSQIGRELNDKEIGKYPEIFTFYNPTECRWVLITHKEIALMQYTAQRDTKDSTDANLE